MKNKEEKSEKLAEEQDGSNPSRATSQLLSDYLGVGQTSVFEPLKRGIFEPDFSPLQFEQLTTILYPETRVRFEGHPDIQILSPDFGVKRECIPVFVPQNGELCYKGVSS